MEDQGEVGDQAELEVQKAAMEEKLIMEADAVIGRLQDQATVTLVVGL